MTVFTQWGSHGRALCGSAGQHQSSRRRAATSHQDRPLFRLIVRVAFTSLAQPSAPFPHLADDRPQLKCLGQHHHGPTITSSHINSKRFDPAHRAAATKDKALECERSVLEHVIELTEINIHDWARAPGHLAAQLMPTSVTIRRRPAGSEGSLLRSGRGRMPVITAEPL